MRGVNSQMDKPKEELKTVKVSTVRPPLYRYYCDACSHDAFYSDKKEVMKRVACQYCNKDFTTNLENYLPNRY